MATTALLAQECEILTVTTRRFRLSFASTMEDLRACQRLRYLVFNCELGQGLTRSEQPGLDQDRFDVICDHLMVHDAVSGRLAGTYRMQSGYRAKGNLGYYSEQLFDFAPLEVIRSEVLELGRACIHSDYRNTTALSMLWKGIVSYAALCNARYLIGCSSISSQDENEGLALYEALRDRYLVETSLRTEPRPGCRCGHNGAMRTPPSLPPLFRAYLDISARVCGPPAIDREFKTIDFLTLLDFNEVPRRVRSRFF